MLVINNDLQSRIKPVPENHILHNTVDLIKETGLNVEFEITILLCDNVSPCIYFFGYINSHCDRLAPWFRLVLKS
jgi:hypothetical protein